LTSFVLARSGVASPLKLEEGVNEVTVWVVNRGGEELRDLRLEARDDMEILPDLDLVCFLYTAMLYRDIERRVSP